MDASKWAESGHPIRHFITLEKAVHPLNPGVGRDLWPPWAPAFAGVTRHREGEQLVPSNALCSQVFFTTSMAQLPDLGTRAAAPAASVKCPDRCLY